MRIKKSLASVFGACAIALATPAAQAGPLPENTGWLFDLTFGFGTPSFGSEWTFSVPSSGATFSIVDSFLEGEVFTVTDATLGVIATTAAIAPTYGVWTAPSDPDGDAYWDDSSYGRAQVFLAPGDYALTIVADSGFFDVSGFFIRLDVPVVPAPAAFLVFGVGLAGLVAARRLKPA
jgi:hypothetical protein